MQEIDLGPQLGEHHSRPGLRRSSLFLAGGALLVAFVGAGIAFWRWTFALRHFGPAVVWRMATPWFVLAGLAGGVALLAFLRALLTRRSNLITYRAGLRYQRGRKPRLLFWRDVRSIQTEAIEYRFPLIGPISRASVTLELNQGASLRFDQSLSDLDDFIETAKRNVYPKLLVDYTRAFRSGQVLTFGPLRLSNAGLKQGRRQIPWRGLKQAFLGGGVLTLQGEARSRLVEVRIPARRIPNVDLCLQLIHHLRSGA